MTSAWIYDCVERRLLKLCDKLILIHMFISDINECDSTPCSNGGICSNSPGSFDCTCDGTGYDGDLCEDGE